MTPRMDRIRRGFEPAPQGSEERGNRKQHQPEVGAGRRGTVGAAPLDSEAREFMSALLPRRRVRTFSSRCVWCGGRCFGKVCADCRDLEAIYAGRAE